MLQSCCWIRFQNLFFFFAKEVSEPVARFSEMLRVFDRTSCCWIRLRKIRMCLMQVIHTYLEWIVVWDVHACIGIQIVVSTRIEWIVVWNLEMYLYMHLLRKFLYSQSTFYRPLGLLQISFSQTEPHFLFWLNMKSWASCGRLRSIRKRKCRTDFYWSQVAKPFEVSPPRIKVWK